MSSNTLDRIQLVATVLESPPRVHRFAPTQLWNTQPSCYEFMARHVSPGSRTLETGAGMSTVLFAGWASRAKAKLVAVSGSANHRS